MDLRTKQYLRRIGDREVWVALHYRNRDPGRPIEFLGGPALRLDYINTVLARTSAKRALAAMSEDYCVDVEVVDDSMARRVGDLLSELYRVVLYDHLGFFRLAVINLSIGPPKALLNSGRCAEKAVHRAFRVILDDLDVPVVVSAGNDGPEKGTLNPWCQTAGVIGAVAADQHGTHIWPRSSRPFLYSDEAPFHMFAAHGENTIGALPLDEQKTPEMLDAETNIDLAAVVGAENVDYFSVRSGTSFAAGWISRTLSFCHQMIQMLEGYASGTKEREHAISPFVRGYIDTGIDEAHPVFDKRLADKRFKYSGLLVDFDVERKQRLFSFFAGNAVDLRIRYGVRSALRFLKEISCPIPEASPTEQGHGFVSFEGADTFVRNARFSTLINLFGEPDDPRLERWLHASELEGDPLLFSTHEAQSIRKYCENYDLLLALPLSRR